MQNCLERRCPEIASKLPRLQFASLPTPVTNAQLREAGKCIDVSVKCDDRTSPVYGGNKVRKLEYLLHRARQRGATRIATFGSIASNHATATSLFAQREGFSCTAFLAHQTRTPAAGRALNMHLKIGTRIVQYGGDRAARIATLRHNLHAEKTWIVPLGGTSWLGVVGFIDAGLELADQVEAGELAEPDELYVAMGTMGTVAGLALGLALGGLRTRVQAVRVTPESVANAAALDRLLRKTSLMLNRLDASIPADLAEKANVSYRPEFFGDGYAKSNPETDRAVLIAADQLGLGIEATYTGKAFRALLSDAREGRQVLFWNTYNSVQLPVDTLRPGDTAPLPAEFLSYFD